MKSITFMLEYGCIPIWVDNKNGEPRDVGLPEDLEDNLELAQLLKEIMEEHDALFINNKIEFSFQDFSTEEDKKRFEQKVFKAIDMLKDAAQGKYEIVVEYSPYTERN